MRMRRAALSMLLAFLLSFGFLLCPALAFTEDSIDAPDDMGEEPAVEVNDNQVAPLDEATEPEAEKAPEPGAEEEYGMTAQSAVEDPGLTAASTVSDLTLYDIDGTTSTLSALYGGTKRVVIVGRAGCIYSIGVLDTVIKASTEEEYQGINFLALDYDGDRAAFQQWYGPSETDRVRFYSSDDDTYYRWARAAAVSTGAPTEGAPWPIIVAIDENDNIVGTHIGPMNVVDICEEFFGISNPYASTADVRGYVDTEQGRELLDLVNESRIAAGVDQLVWDADLAACAMQRAPEIAAFFSNERPNRDDGITAWPSWSTSGAESIAEGQQTVQEVNTFWTNSEEDYANMVNGDMASFGAALYVNDAGERYWVGCFSSEIGPNGEGTLFAGEWATTIPVDARNITTSISTAAIDLELGMTFQMGQPKLGAADLLNPKVTWSSSDPSVATVDQNGLITAVHPGEADITAILTDSPKFIATATVTVGGTNIQNASVSLEGDAGSFTYTGAPITPSVTVKAGSRTLREGADYALEYQDNTQVGTARIVITGTGTYTGAKTVTFTIVAPPEPPAPAVSFRDVTAATPHADDISWLASSGISAGWTEKDGTRTFRPTNTVIRQDMAAFLFRLAKLWGLVDESWQPTGKVTFRDVSPATPHYREIMWLAESGISAGWKKGESREFRPTNTVVRQDMAAFLRRLQALRDPSVKDWKPTGASPFRDVTSSTPHSEDILWLAESGVSAGWKVGGTKEFRPTNTVIRQDMAAFLHRLDGLG